MTTPVRSEWVSCQRRGVRAGRANLPGVPEPQTTECPACGAVLRPWASKYEHLLSRCGACGTIQARPLDPTTRTSADYVAYHEKASFRTSDHAAPSLEELVRSARAYRRSGRWLDIGFGEGTLLRAAERHGWNCCGVEASPQALAFGRDRGWTVAEPDAATDLFPKDGFDVVTLVEVIEHLAHPADALRQAVGWLRPGALLYLTTPNAGSLNRRLQGPRWSVFCPPEHLTIWSPQGLRTTLSRLGLTRFRVRTHGFNPAEILASWKSAGAPVNRQQAAESLNRALSHTSLRRAAKRMANRLLSLLGVGDTLKVWCEKPGGTTGA